MLDVPLSVKYRPKKIADVIGQKVVTQSIVNAFKSKTLHHAYIFGGKYGSGKTTCARILAAMENCEKGPTLEPCGECKNCQEIFSGKSQDVLELDAASNRGIDDIRAIYKDIRYSPVNCRTKYVIIDEAHSLTGAGAEAALKMIEEPPPKVRFILATTDTHALKDTIHSRCISLKFHKVSVTELAQHLIKIAATEKIDCDEDALKLAARTSDGSVRNSLQNLQTLMNFTGGSKITLEIAKQVLSAIDESSYFDFVDAIVKLNTIQGINCVENILKDGKDAQEVVNGFYRHLRNIMIAKTCGSQLSSFNFTEEEVKRYTLQGTSIGLELLIEMMASLVDLNRGLTLNLDPQILFEKYFIQSAIAYKKAEMKKKATQP